MMVDWVLKLWDGVLGDWMIRDCGLEVETGDGVLELWYRVLEDC